MRRHTPVLLLLLAAGAIYWQAKAQTDQGSSYPPVLVQATNVVTDAAGNFTVTWNTSFSNANPFIAPLPITVTGNNPIDCQVVTRNATTVTGWCRQSTITLLNLSIITAGLNLNPFASIPSTGTTVMVIGRDVTQ